MKNKQFFAYLLFSIALLCSCADGKKPKTHALGNQNLERPNIVYILADDMGYGDISALNPNARVHTPALDSLAASGMSFSDAHSSSSVCTPSRYSILTGRYAWRTSLKRGVTWGYSPPLIDSARTTVASLLKQEGYRTACIGKWHLGMAWGVKDGHKAPWDDNEYHPSKYPGNIIDFTKPITHGPNSLGFDYFFGISASLDMRPYCFIENDRVLGLPMRHIQKEILVERDSLIQWPEGLIAKDFKHAEVLPVLTEKAIAFIKENKKGPFFLYFPLTAPHNPLLPSAPFKGKSKAGFYGDFVEMVDHTVKRIANTLKVEGLEKNTIFIFTSDNGTFQRAYLDPKYNHNGNFIYRGQKADIFEGGHRVPFIASWPSKIAPSSISDTPILLNDLLATVAELTEFDLKEGEGEDSRSILPVLLGTATRVEKRDLLIHHSSRGFFAVRKDSLKLIQGLGSGGFTVPHTLPVDDDEKAFQLYDLKNDISEEENIFNNNDPKHLELIEILKKTAKASQK
ncbi:sulfatase family protein [Maribacter sp. 2307ULW6-5]|uniref:sulfatase family protein n=1 Tax=Maribacter sp. 2307ULW6-5 TaxID=3386275 RepID=UPI0039BD5E5A